MWPANGGFGVPAVALCYYKSGPNVIAIHSPHLFKLFLKFISASIPICFTCGSKNSLKTHCHLRGVVSERQHRTTPANGVVKTAAAVAVSVSPAEWAWQCSARSGCSPQRGCVPVRGVLRVAHGPFGQGRRGLPWLAGLERAVATEFLSLALSNTAGGLGSWVAMLSEIGRL